MTRTSNTALAIRFVVLVVSQLRWRLAISAALAVALAFVEGAGVLLLIPLLESAGLAVGEGATSRLADVINALFAAVNLRSSLLAVLGVFLLVSLAHAWLYRAHLLFNPTLEQQFAQALRTRLYAAIVRADWTFFTSRRTSDLVHAVTSEVDRTGTSVYQLLTLLTGIAVSTVYVGIALQLSPALTALVAATGLVTLWALRQRTRRTGEMGERYTDANRRQFHMASESIAGLKVAKSFGAEARDAMIFGELTRERATAYLDLLRSYARAKLGIDMATAVSISLLLLVAVEGFGLQGAGLLLLLFIFARVMPRVMSLQESAQIIAAGLPSFRTVQTLIDECESRGELVVAAAERLPLRMGVELHEVSYAYGAESPTVLDSVTLDIPAGQTTAIVGVSGAGKSTIADLLLGLLRPTAGTVRIDDRPLEDAGVSGWRRSIGYVPQETFLLHDTIRANFQWARPDATDEEIWRVLERAAAADFVRARPEGLDTVVGDRGLRLSGGERQRLALARALITDPQLLILDEATSALDAINEEKILAAVGQLTGGVTTVIITHRLAAIREADLIYVLDEGRLADAGTWPELASREGRFAELLASQGIRDSIRDSGSGIRDPRFRDQRLAISD